MAISIEARQRLVREVHREADFDLPSAEGHTGWPSDLLDLSADQLRELIAVWHEYRDKMDDGAMGPSTPVER
jgi:hypothetical protein